MPSFCDVALPVPLDMVFTYRNDGQPSIIGGRVLVPFRNDRLSGVVTALHDREPSMQAKSVLEVLDQEPALDATLMQLGRWIAQYYLAPLGEVFRTMLPLAAEIKKARVYSITETGHAALAASATLGSSRRSRQGVDTQMLEYAVLDYLAMSDDALEGTLRSATRASLRTLENLVRKRWITRQDASAARDARRTVQVAVLKDRDHAVRLHEVKLNDNQRKIISFMEQNQGRALLTTIRELGLPRTTLPTLVKRGLVEVSEEAAEFNVAGLKRRGPAHLDFIFNAQQKAALQSIRGAVAEGKFSVSLLHGVTGSGKTAVYLAAMQAVLESGRSAILLVPEIGLTPAAAANLHQVFGEQVAILHSALSGDERAEQWHRIRRGEARIVVGTRSAVFAPVSNLALIVVDEEHDASYKQEETPRYHGRDVAVMRGKLGQAAVVLASATPSIESYHNSETGKYQLLELSERVERRPLPEVEVVDMKFEFRREGKDEAQLFSRQLVVEVSQCLERGEQAMILLNRRGYSAIVLCRSCGETLQCKNCSIALTYHKSGYRMECHYCGYRQAVPKRCPGCDSEYIYFLGAGSEKVEERLHAAFPQARIGRLDRDTVRTRHDFERVLNQLHAGEINLLVGTQMIAKGHDVHGVTLVGVVGADYALGFPDFRAAERTFQLLTQVAGRAGRGETPGRVILQTFHPEHYAIEFAQRHDYKGFYEKEVRFRRWMHYPPFSALANVLVRSDKLDQTLRWTGRLARWFESTRHEGVRVLGPSVAPIMRLKRDYRYHFIVKAASREKLGATLRGMLVFAAEQKISRTNVIVDVDALSLL